MRAVEFMHISQFGVVLVDPWVSVLVRTYIRPKYDVLSNIKQNYEATNFPAILSCIIMCYICYIYTLPYQKLTQMMNPARFARSLSVLLLGHQVSSLARGIIYLCIPCALYSVLS